MESESIIKKLKSEYKDKKVLIVGLGIQGGGEGVARFFAKLGAQVTVTDQKKENELKDTLERLKDYNISYSLGKHKKEDFLSAQIIFKGPSVRWNIPEIEEAEKKGIPVEMETSFFASHSPAPIIGVTGSRGKSTTSSMIYTVLQKNNYSVFLAGNVPHSSTLELLEKIDENDTIVLELSSYQLSGFRNKKISPHIAVFTTFYPDHLNYYSSMQQYYDDKSAIYKFQKQGDFLIINENLKKLIEKDKLNGQKIVFYKNNDFPLGLRHLKGEHNLENASAAYKTLLSFGLNEDKIIDKISNFQTLPFRQEIVAVKEDVIFINDTTSTTPIATIKAIESFKERKIYLILGGNSKNLPTEDLVKRLDEVEKIYLLKGTFTDEIHPYLNDLYPDKIEGIFSNLEAAVMQAFQDAKKENDNEAYVLFSPAATSFGMFKNEFDRGKKFNQIVEEL